MTVLRPSFPPYKVTTTRIGVPKGKGLVIAALAISSTERSDVAAAADTPEYFKNCLRVTVFIPNCSCEKTGFSFIHSPHIQDYK